MPKLTRTPIHGLEIISGRANLPLTREIEKILGVTALDVSINNFEDGEIRIMMNDSVRDKDVFIIQPTCPPVNDNLMELCALIDTVSRASAREITVVLPYFGYGRQDRKKHGREPIMAALAADFICKAGNVKRIVTLDLHNASIQGMFPVKICDHFRATEPLTQWIRANWLHDGDAVIVSPDIGGVARASAFAHTLDLATAIIDKRRSKSGAANARTLIGSVKGKTAILVDDMIDTAGTITKGAQLLMEKGASRVFVAATTGLFSGPAIERIEASPIIQIAVTNAVPIPVSKMIPKITVVSIADLLADAIKRIFLGESLSEKIGWLNGDE
ncbi:MAG: ribose-phosphate diphosphokinase [bacterium]|nr:ribose-phosphate diphosphokinase [bacterium]